MNDFLKNNYLNIFFFVVFTFLFLAISQTKWNFNPTIPPPKLIQQVTLETMDNMDLSDLIDPINSFCASFLGDASNLEKACNRLTDESCHKTSCCVYTDKYKCIAGSKHGPTFRTDPKGNSIDHTYYYHLGKKYS